MPELIEQNAPPQVPAFIVQPGIDERQARRTLLEQVAHIEDELASLFCATFPRTGFDWQVSTRGGPRILSLGELERLRDELASKLQQNRHELSERTWVEEANRRHIEEMLLDPAAHKWERVTNADIGEVGCKQWHVLPRHGLIGMLLGWWQVKISSGCPLARGRGPRP